MTREVLSQREIEKVIMALANGGKEFSEDDALKAVQWAKEAVISWYILALILKGRAGIEILDNGELGFKSVEATQ